MAVKAAKRRVSGRSAAEGLDGHRSEGYDQSIGQSSGFVKTTESANA